MKKYLTLFGLILSSIIVFSQELKTYSGVYCEDCEETQFLKNEATYSYYQNDKLERIFDGNFKYTGIDISETRTVEHYKVTILGQYKNNLQNGLWTYKRTYVDGKSYYSYNLWGENHILQIPTTDASGKFELGYRVGTWELKTLLNKKVTENYLAHFKKTKFQSDFLFETETFSVKGFFNDEGYLTGDWDITWSLGQIPYRTNLVFVNGIITKSITQNSSTGEIILKTDNSIFEKTFFENLKENQFFSIIDDKIYIQKDKKHKIDTVAKGLYFRSDATPQFYSDQEREKIGLNFLYASLNFWIYPTITKTGYKKGDILAEIRKGIVETEYITERKIVNITEDELLKIAEDIEAKNTFIEKIKEKKRIEEEKQIAEKKRIKEEERKAKKLKEDINQYDKNSTDIYHNNNKISGSFYGYSKHFIAAQETGRNFFNAKLKDDKFSEEQLKTSFEYLKFQNKILSLLGIDTKTLDKQLKKTDDPQTIINLINSYNNGN